MAETTIASGGQSPGAVYGDISEGRRRLGRWLLIFASVLLVAVLAVLAYDASLDEGEEPLLGFENWRPLLYAFIVWSVALGAAQVLIRGEPGSRALFILPAVLFTIAMVIFPTFFGLYIAFTDWNLSSFEGRQFNGLENFYKLLQDPYYWNALTNMVWYVLAILVEYMIAFGLALLLNAEIKGRRFFRVAFLLPFMLSPVAISWIVGKSMMEVRFGPIANLARFLGWDTPAFFTDPVIARISIMVMDGWMYIPFMMILLLAGLQAMPRDVVEAAKVDGATKWQAFWRITFPLMLAVSVTTIILRIIFKLKLADIIINVTSGGPGGATDSVTSFIFREYRDRSNVGYGTMLAEFYLILIILFLAFILVTSTRWVRRYSQ